MLQAVSQSEEVGGRLRLITKTICGCDDDYNDTEHRESVSNCASSQPSGDNGATDRPVTRLCDLDYQPRGAARITRSVSLLVITDTTTPRWRRTPVIETRLRCISHLVCSHFSITDSIFKLWTVIVMLFLAMRQIFFKKCTTIDYTP